MGRGLVVGGWVEGEMYEIGLILGCLFLSRRGLRIVYLGANLPLEHLLRTIRRIRPPLVLLSASTPESAERLALDIRRLQAHGADADSTQTTPCPRIAYGGYAFVTQPELKEGIDGLFL